jgi:murein DD-endopeptidase MepM/ murein hydrolase activator NlpD
MIRAIRVGMASLGVAVIALVAVPFVAFGGASSQPGTNAPPDRPLPLAALDQRIADADSQSEADNSELGRLGEELVLRHATVLSRGKAFYRLTRAGLLPIGGGFGALVAHAMHVERARRVLASDIQTEMHLHSRAADLARDLDRIASDRVALEGQRAAMYAARTVMEDDQRRQVAFDKAFETSTGAVGGGYVAVYGGNALAPDTPAGGFATARGRLLLPIAGRAEVSPVRREGTEGPGLEIRAPAGTPVRAVFAGRVAFADRYGPLGRIVILDHGDHYYTVSGNLDEIDVKIGQDVGAGERVGTVGDDGRGSTLYFEVRHGAHTVAPEVWLGL